MSEQTIPTLDLNDFHSPERRAAFVAGVSAALREVGFFALVGHGIEDAEVERVYQLAEQVFALPEETKLRYEKPELLAQRGYTSFGREHAKDNPAPDLKEYWSVGPDLPAGPYPANLWPEEVPEFRELTQSLFARLEALAHPILRACALAVGEREDLFSELVREGDSLLRVIHYPEIPADRDPASVRAAAHEDINFLTLLCGASAEGLEIMTREGDWLPVRAIPGQLIVDSGDMFQRLSNGYFQATRHRVVNPGSARERRFSMPCFVHPRPEVDLTPLASCVALTGGERRFEGSTAGGYLQERLEALGLGV